MKNHEKYKDSRDRYFQSDKGKKTSVRLQRKYRLMREYGLTEEAWDVLHAAQDGLCAICLRTCSTGRNLAVDHCHTTKRVRGLLCAACNRAIGNFGDDPERLRRAAEYLEEAHAEDVHG